MPSHHPTDGKVGSPRRFFALSIGVVVDACEFNDMRSSECGVNSCDLCCRFWKNEEKLRGAHTDLYGKSQ